MSEHALWGRIRKGLVEVEPMIDLSRVENAVEAGMPDVNYACLICEGWIELKHRGDVPSGEETPVFKTGGLRDSQILWIDRRVKRGGRVFILAQVEDMLFLVHGCYARVFNTWTLTDMYQNARWKHCGVKPAWRDLLSALCFADNRLFRGVMSDGEKTNGDVSGT